MEPLQEWDFNVTVTVPTGTDSQDYLIGINAKSSGDSLVTALSNITVSVEEFYKLEPRRIQEKFGLSDL